MRQQLYLDSRFGQSNGSITLFWIEDPIVLPSLKYAFTLSVPSAAVALTHYVITEANRKLDLIYSNDNEPAQLIDFPIENHSIDELVDVLNIHLLHRFKAAYSENTNTLNFTTPNINDSISIGPLTTSTELIGVRIGYPSVLGSYTAPDGANLAGTTCF